MSPLCLQKIWSPYPKAQDWEGNSKKVARYFMHNYTIRRPDCWWWNIFRIWTTNRKYGTFVWSRVLRSDKANELEITMRMKRHYFSKILKVNSFSQPLFTSRYWAKGFVVSDNSPLCCSCPTLNCNQPTNVEGDLMTYHHNFDPPWRRCFSLGNLKQNWKFLMVGWLTFSVASRTTWMRHRKFI